MKFPQSRSNDREKNPYCYPQRLVIVSSYCILSRIFFTSKYEITPAMLPANCLIDERVRLIGRLVRLKTSGWLLQIRLDTFLDVKLDSIGVSSYFIPGVKCTSLLSLQVNRLYKRWQLKPDRIDSFRNCLRLWQSWLVINALWVRCSSKYQSIRSFLSTLQHRSICIYLRRALEEVLILDLQHVHPLKKQQGNYWPTTHICEEFFTAKSQIVAVMSEN